jgi:hypothetical protein
MGRSETERPPDSAYRRFLRHLPLTLVVAMALWLMVRPALDVAVPKFAEVLIRAFEYPRVTRLVPSEHWVEVRRSDFRSGSAIPTVPLTEIHFNTIILLALHLATARPFSRAQLERLVMAWCVLYLTQSLNLVFHIKTIYALGLGEWSLQNYSSVTRNVFASLQYFTDLPGRFSFPFLIWMGFNWDRVIVVVGIADEPAEASKKPSTQKRTTKR